MSDRQTKDLIKKWAKRDGAHRVKATLIQRRLSSSFVEKVVADRYENEIRGANLTIIEDELLKAGVLKDEAS